MPATKTSHQPNLRNFHQLVLFCSSTEGGFHPSSPEISLTNLQNKLLAAQEAAHQLVVATLHYKKLVAQRYIAAKELRSLATRIGNAFLATGISSVQFRHMRKTIDRIQNNHNQDTNSGSKTKKRSQQSFSALAQLFQTLINILDTEPLYQVNEEQLKIITLKNVLDDFNTLSSQLMVAKTTCNTVRLQRDHEFYHQTTGMVTLAVKIKHYIRSCFGYSSSQFRQMAKFQFD